MVRSVSDVEKTEEKAQRTCHWTNQVYETGGIQTRSSEVKSSALSIFSQP